jgi:peptide deformylase
LRHRENRDLKIITYPHPTLRHASKPVRRVDTQLRKIVERMFELMYQANGIGLAANQVDLPLRFFICNLSGHPHEGEELVMINPVLRRPKGQLEQEEGCLSLPGLYAPVKRPETIELEAYTLDGSMISGRLEGMMARVVQHEVDHLDGVLFTDRLTPTGELTVQPALEEFELDFRSRRECGEIPDDNHIAIRLAQWEQQYAMEDVSQG